MPPKRASLSSRPLPSTAPARASDETLLGRAIKRQEVEEILLRDIMPNRQQPRSAPQDAHLDELAASIRDHGVMQPVVVRPIPLTLYEGAGRRYELVAGERRWRASALANKTTIPAIVQSFDDQAMLELAIIENLQREDLNPLDEARALAQLRDMLQYSLPRIAATIGKGEGYVRNRLRLLVLPADLQALVMVRPDTLVHVLELARVTDETQRAVLLAAVRDDDLSYAETKRRVKALTEEPSTQTAISHVNQPRDTPEGGVYVNTPDTKQTRVATTTRVTQTATQEQTTLQGGVYVNTPRDMASPNGVSALQVLQQYADGLKLLATAADTLVPQHTDALIVLDEIERTIATLRRVLQ